MAPDLTLPGHPEIFVIGDTAQVEGTNGPLPGVAPVAKQQGAYVAGVIAARLAGKPPPGRSVIAISATSPPSVVTRQSSTSVGCA